MKSRRAFIAALVVAVATLMAAITPSPGARAAESYVFKTIDVPNSASTTVMANNAAGDIVGYYSDANKVVHGFLLRGGAFTTLDYPGTDVAWTNVNAINDAGDVAGTYSLKSPAPAGNVHGFLRTRTGEWSTQDYPEGTYIMQGGAFAILADGTVVGCVHEGAPITAMFGYTNGSTGAEFFSYPAGAPFAMHYGATPDGKTLVGGYRSGGTGPDSWHGYLLNSGKVTTVDVPGKTGTQLMGITAGKAVAGLYRVQVGTAWHARGFVALTSGSLDPASWNFVMVDVPNAVQTVVRNMNAPGEVVGYYYDAGGVAHGFLATAAPAAPAPPAAAPPASQAPKATTILNQPFRGVNAPGSTFDLVQSVVDFGPGAKSAAMTATAAHYLSVISGELSFDVDGKAETVAAGKGISAPSGSKLTISNAGAASARLFVSSLLQVGGVAEVHQINAPGVKTFGTARRTMTNAPAVVDIVQLAAVYDPGYRTPNHIMNEFHLMLHLAGVTTYGYLDKGKEVEQYPAGTQATMYEGRPGYMSNTGAVPSSMAWTWVANPGKPLTTPVKAPAPPATGNAGLADSGEPVVSRDSVPLAVLAALALGGAVLAYRRRAQAR